MAFSVEDFQDLVRLLEQRPEWRAELRRLTLTEELLGLPAVVRALAEQVQALAQTVQALGDAQRRTEQEVGVLAHTLNEFGRVQNQMRAQLNQMRDQIGGLRGSDLERRYREHAGGYFGGLLQRVRVVGAEELDDLLEAGTAAGALDAAAARDVRLADLIVRGRRPDGDEETYLVVEVSVSLDAEDVERATRRAGHLGRLRPTLAVVAGEQLTAEAAALAETRGVWRMLDGRSLAPSER